MNDRRNPSVIRGDGETRESYIGRVSELLSRIEWQSEGHRQWYTHKNPYGCWICEVLQISRELETELLDKRGTIREESTDEQLDDQEFYNYDEESIPDDEDLNTTES